MDKMTRKEYASILLNLDNNSSLPTYNMLSVSSHNTLWDLVKKGSKDKIELELVNEELKTLHPDFKTAIKNEYKKHVETRKGIER